MENGDEHAGDDREHDPEARRAGHIAWALEQGTIEHLRGATFRWTSWEPTPAIEYDPRTETETPGYFDHDHCHICYENSFSTCYDFDADEGWMTTRPPGIPAEEHDDYQWWICTACFERFREQFEWKTLQPTDR